MKVKELIDLLSKHNMEDDIIILHEDDVFNIVTLPFHRHELLKSSEPICDNGEELTLVEPQPI